MKSWKHHTYAIPIVIRATILKWLTFESYESMDMCRIGDKKMGV